MQRSIPPMRRRLSAIIAGLFLTLVAASVWASHGESFIDLTTDNTIVTHDGAVYAQGGVGAGTGTFDPFLTLEASSQSPASQAGTQDGYNQCDDAGCPDERGDAPNYYDQFFGGGRTHELLVSAIPTLEYNGELYREFSLDANDEGSDTWMSIDEIKIFVDTQVNLTTYDNTTETFANDTGVAADEIFDMDSGGNQSILMVSQGLESGSGVSDVTVLVPNDLFPTSCAYGSTTCNLYLYFWSSMGHLADGDHSGVNCTQDPCDWDISAGFEEWRIRFLPVVNVAKTAVESFARDYDWTVDKGVSDETIDLFDGDSQTVTWDVTPTRGPAEDGAFEVEGTITITNPTGALPITEEITATINSVEDVLEIDGSSDDLTVSCPVTFPYELDAGETLVCTYSSATPGADATSSGLNTATVEIESGIPDGDGGIDFGDTVEYEGTAAVDFATATPVVTDDTATLTDDRGPLDQAAADGVTVTYDETFDCGEDEGSYTNTAVVTEDDSQDSDDDDASVTVNCYGLTVSKTAVASFSREYDWTVTKSVLPTSLSLFDGDSDDVTWSVGWDRGIPTTFNHLVTGTITIQNPAPIAADDVSVTDVVSVAIAATVDCDAVAAGNQTTVDIAASSSAACAYSVALPDGANRTNTATATLFGEAYTGSQPVTFVGVTPTDIDATAVVTDDRGPLDTPVSDDGSTTYDETFTCGEDAGTHDNTAVVTEDDTGESDDATATATVTCYEITVTKDADTTYSRDYDWSIEKTRFIAEGEDDGDGDPLTLTLDEGQTYTANYEFTATMTGFTDADHAVSGTITISNPAPMIADDVAVTDVLSHAVDADIAATVDCDPVLAGDQATVDVPAAAGGTPGTATCAYDADLPDSDDRVNTATATLFGIGYSGTANVTFDLDNPTTEIDECIDVTDNAGTPGDATDDLTQQICLDDLDENDQYTFEYTIDIGPYATCDTYLFTNTVSFTTTDDDNDTDESGSDTYTVTVEVPCPQGCTLTQGYWRTHNDSFWGGAPTDETWELLGDADGDGTPEAEGETFFLSGLTYFEVMWSAPRGNAYFNLANQYIAAQLNMLDGADGSAISAAFASATTLFQTYTDEEIAALKGKAGNALRAQFISLAGTLGSYNEGLIGPGHCDENNEVSSAGAAPMVADSRSRFVG